jgi:signal transduction histidine kinase
VEGCLWGRATV